MTWLHLPSSVSSPASGGGYSQPSTCSDGGPSAMSSGTNMPSKCSRQGSEMDTCMTPQSGTTLSLSTGDRSLDLWMLSLRAFRASRLASLEKDSQRMTPATDGRQLSASFAKYDPDMRSWRMYPVLSLSHISDEYLGTWPKRVSILSRIAFRRRRSGRTTNGNGSGLLPTPTAQQMGSNTSMRKRGTTYMERVVLYPTPKVARGTYQYQPGSRKKNYTLEGLALHDLWPTPTAGDGKDRKRSRKSKAAGSGPTLLEKVMFQTPGTAGIDGGSHGRKAARKNGTFVTHNGGKLNPTWVEWLMGWPLGWTALEALGTDKFQEWLSKHGAGTEVSE
jgi:hypothetical protein